MIKEFGEKYFCFKVDNVNVEVDYNDGIFNLKNDSIVKVYYNLSTCNNNFLYDIGKNKDFGYETYHKLSDKQLEKIKKQILKVVDFVGKFKVEKMNDFIEIFTFEDTNNKGKSIVVEFTKSLDRGLSQIWCENKLIENELESWWSVDVLKKEFIDDIFLMQYECCPKLNPTITTYNYKGKIKRGLNFEFVLKANDFNKLKILCEVAKRAKIKGANLV